ncbi:aminotransferase class IV [Ornithinimicrobium sp. Y1694]|uniref:aminotransferase class IV n=1 Tax=Ornithinimicrobium sp. Y1694 TaxID=3418590 RepID=UPI003CFB135C
MSSSPPPTPPGMPQPRVWVDGHLVEDRPSFDALDHGITVGDGVFETAKVVDGQIFALTRHLDRMERSLAGLGLEPLDRGRVQLGLEAVLDVGPIAFGRIRWTVTAGPGPLGSDRAVGAATYLVTAVEQDPPGHITTVAVVPWVRNERSALAGLKTTSYAENVVALAEAKRLGATEALLANTQGRLCEGTGSNVFVVIDGVVHTPSLAEGPLAGVTRELTIEWLREEGVEVVEGEIPMTALATAEEIFVTSSIRDVAAVERVEVAQATRTLGGLELSAPLDAPRDLGDAPGAVTAQAQEIFTRRAAETLDP